MKASNWISVEDRLPRTPDYVFVCRECGGERWTSLAAYVRFEECGYIFKSPFVEMYEVTNGWHLHIDNKSFETALSIKYLHQLQNAYYLVAGKELEINL